MLEVFPVSCLQDEPCTITAKNLLPFQEVTVTCHVKDVRGKRFYSFAHYKANNCGVVDLSIDESAGGSYIGCFRMGLLISMKPEPDEFKFLRLFKRDVEKPNMMIFKLYEGYQTPETIFSSKAKPLQITTHYRHFMGPGVKRFKITEGRLRGALFLPPGKGPFPGVIDLFGTAGGLLEFRSAQLASKGIAAFALAYFDYEDLPHSTCELELAYFREAVDFLLHHPKIRKPSVGVVGTSKGAEMALAMAAFIPEVRLVFAINGSCCNTGSDLIIDEGYTFPNLPYDGSKIKIIDKSYIINSGGPCDPDEYPDTIIPIDKSEAYFVFIVGEFDENYRSAAYAKRAIQVLESAGKKNFKLFSYAGAGHLIEPPYSPLCELSFHKVYNMSFLWGGSAKPHSEAQEDSWNRLLRAVEEHLGPLSHL